VSVSKGSVKTVTAGGVKAGISLSVRVQ